MYRLVMPLDLRGRHHQIAPPVVGWKCPACDASNTGPLEQGCASCGSGKPGRFVGVDPPARRSIEASSSDMAFPPADGNPMDAAYWIWLKANPRNPNLGWTEEWVYAAFKAGYEAALGRVVQPEVQISGTAESRTIIAALRLFLENVLPTATDEIASGEFLSIQQTEELIRRIERKG